MKTKITRVILAMVLITIAFTSSFAEGGKQRNEGGKGRSEGGNQRNEGSGQRNEGGKEKIEGSKDRNEGGRDRNFTLNEGDKAKVTISSIDEGGRE